MVIGHSTGGLTVPLWLDARGGTETTRHVAGLIVNSPWFELPQSPLRRRFSDLAIAATALARPHAVLSRPSAVYGESIHRDHRGEWDFDLALKPLRGFPERAGWLRAVRRGHARLRRGLDVGVPVLVLHASRSLLSEHAWTPAAMSADTVLDVEHIKQHAHNVGRDVELAEIDEAMHDVFLSREPARRRALETVDAWLARTAVADS